MGQSWSEKLLCIRSLIKVVTTNAVWMFVARAGQTADVFRRGHPAMCSIRRNAIWTGEHEEHARLTPMHGGLGR